MRQQAIESNQSLGMFAIDRETIHPERLAVASAANLPSQGLAALDQQNSAHEHEERQREKEQNESANDVDHTFEKETHAGRTMVFKRHHRQAIQLQQTRFRQVQFIPLRDERDAKPLLTAKRNQLLRLGGRNIRKRYDEFVNVTATEEFQRTQAGDGLGLLPARWGATIKMVAGVGRAWRQKTYHLQHEFGMALDFSG